MDKKGFIDKAITGWFALIVIFFAMVVFIGISSINVISNYYNVPDRIPGNVSYGSIDSRVLMELFLGDVINIDGENLTMYEALDKLSINTRFSRVSDEKYSSEIEKAFLKKYSCDGNAIAIDQILGGELLDGNARGTAEQIVHLNNFNFLSSDNKAYSMEIYNYASTLRIAVKGVVEC